jgi:hypothetical protein
MILGNDKLGQRKSEAARENAPGDEKTAHDRRNILADIAL